MVGSTTQPLDSRFHRILALAKTAILVKDEVGCYVFANPAAEALLGYAPGGLCGKYMSELCPAHPRLIEMAFAQLKRDGAWAGRFTMRRADGSLIDVMGQAFVHAVPDDADLYVDVLYPVEGTSSRQASAVPGSTAAAAAADGHDLTPRDICLLQLMVEAFSDEELALLLGLSEAAVRAAVGGVIGKMKASSRTEACVLAIKHRLVS
ncbi:MAG TPA: PAS domain S-box protein [Dehalococcoidia bacterium]